MYITCISGVPAASAAAVGFRSKSAKTELIESFRCWCKETGMAAAQATVTAEPDMEPFA